MEEFMLVLHDDPSAFVDRSPEEMQKVIEAYQAWAGKLSQEGRFSGGRKLAEDPGKILKRAGDKVVVKDGPFSESKEILGGYFVVRATDYEDAVKLCEDCPHTKYGGTIELRAVDSAG